MSKINLYKIYSILNKQGEKIINLPKKSGKTQLLKKIIMQCIENNKNVDCNFYYISTTYSSTRKIFIKFSSLLPLNSNFKCISEQNLYNLLKNDNKKAFIFCDEVVLDENKLKLLNSNCELVVCICTDSNLKSSIDFYENKLRDLENEEFTKNRKNFKTEFLIKLKNKCKN